MSPPDEKHEHVAEGTETEDALDFGAVGKKIPTMGRKFSVKTGRCARGLESTP